MDNGRSPVNNIPGQVAPPSYQMFGFNNQIQPFNTSDYYHDERLSQSTGDARIGYYNPQRTTEPRQNMTVQATRLQSSNMYHPGETKASMLSSPSSASGSSPASRQLCQGESSVATRHIPSSYHDGSGMVVSASNPSAFHGNYYHMSGDQSDRVHTHIANNSSANNYMLGTSALDQRNMEASQGYQNVLNNQGPYSRSPRPPASPHTELIICSRDGEERRELQAAETLTNLSTR
uniref:Uncharacterized protein n=1 Tax=Ciona savignyi TaxID=51511 RepID=H2ZGF9_CIOSA